MPQGTDPGLPQGPPGAGSPGVGKEIGGDAQSEIDALMGLVQRATQDAMGAAGSGASILPMTEAMMGADPGPAGPLGGAALEREIGGDALMETLRVRPRVLGFPPGAGCDVGAPSAGVVPPEQPGHDMPLAEQGARGPAPAAMEPAAAGGMPTAMGMPEEALVQEMLRAAGVLPSTAPGTGFGASESEAAAAALQQGFELVQREAGGDVGAESGRIGASGDQPEQPGQPAQGLPATDVGDGGRTLTAAATQAMAMAQEMMGAAGSPTAPLAVPGTDEASEASQEYCEVDLREFYGTLAPPTTVARMPTPSDDPAQMVPGAGTAATRGAGERPPDAFNVDLVRQDFPALNQRVNGKPLVWLDNAATTHKPWQVIEAVSRFYERDNSNIHRGAHTLATRATDAYESSRRKVQKFLGAGETREIIFTRGTTESINLVAWSWGRKFVGPGDEIVLSQLEHHSNIVPWQMLCQATGAVLRVVPLNARGEVMQDDYGRLLGPRTRMVAISQVSNALGTVVPVQQMTELAHRYGAMVLVDGAQAVPHMPVNVRDIGCDFYVFSGHKAFAPTGIGVLYGKAGILENMPPWQGGGNMIKNVSFEETTYNDLPDKFEAGTPAIAQVVGLGAAIDYLDQIGLEAAARYEHDLLSYAIERLSEITGLTLIGTSPEKVGVLSFVLEGIRNEDLGRYLDREGIAVRAGHHCAQPALRRFGLKGTVRPSLALYNTKQDVDTLVEAIEKAKQEFSIRNFGGTQPM